MTKPLPRQPFLNEIVLRPKSGLSKLLYGLFDHNPDDTPYTLTFTQTSPGVFQATHTSGKKVYADQENGMRWTESDGVTPADPPGSDITRPGQPDPHVNKHGLMLKLWRYWKESTMGAGDDSPPPAGVPYDELAPPTTGDTSGMTKGHFGSTAISHAAATPMLASGPRTHPITDVVEPGGERQLTDCTTIGPDPDGQAQSHGSEHPSTSGFDPKTPSITPALTPSASGGTMLSGDVRYRLTNRKTISGVVAESDKGPIVSASVTGPHGSVSIHADAETDTSIETRGLYREDPSSPDRWHLVHEETGYAAFTFVDTKSFTVLRHDNYALTRHGLYPKYDGARQIPASGGGSVLRFQVSLSAAGDGSVISDNVPVPFDQTDFDEASGALVLNGDGTVTLPAGNYEVSVSVQGARPLTEQIASGGGKWLLSVWLNEDGTLFGGTNYGYTPLQSYYWESQNDLCISASCDFHNVPGGALLAIMPETGGAPGSLRIWGATGAYGVDHSDLNTWLTIRKVS